MDSHVQKATQEGETQNLLICFSLILIIIWPIFFLVIQLFQDIAQEAVKKRRRATKKPYSRAIVGATLEVIQKKRSEKPEVRDAAREAALRYMFISFLWYYHLNQKSYIYIFFTFMKF